MSYSSFQDWFSAKFDDERCERVVRDGFESGAGGLIYDSQTIPIYNEFSNDIWEIVMNEYSSIHGFVSGRNFLNANDFATQMVWCASTLLAQSRIGGVTRNMS